MKRFAILFAALFGAVGAFAQNDTAYVPFVVNVAATVRAVPAAGTTAVVTQVQMTVAANTRTTLKIPLPKSIGVLNGAQRQLNALALISNRGGKITLNLPAQSYKNAEIALYAVNGKRILRENVSASSAANAISRKNAAPGAYMLSVTGADGGGFTSRLTHGGGNLVLTVAFGGENPSPARQLAKEAAAGDWTVTVSATGRVDSVYAINPVAGTMAAQNITLRETAPVTPGPGEFIDYRDNKTYKYVTIGGKKWMAENLNYETPSDSWCYSNSANNCTTYGRLYTWNTAMTACPSGWHLPTRREWVDLLNAAADGAPGVVEGNALKSETGWNSGCNGTDIYGFKALPGGLRYPDGNFKDAGKSGYWWSATEGDASSTHYVSMLNISGGGRVGGSTGNKECGFAVRCVRD